MQVDEARSQVLAMLTDAGVAGGLTPEQAADFAQWAIEQGTDGPAELLKRESDEAATERLMHYWAEGEGAAKIRWGEPDDFYRCEAHLGKYVGPDKVKGLCANLHHRALGIWPGQEDSHKIGKGVSGYEPKPRTGMVSLDLPEGTLPAIEGGVADHHITICFLGSDVDDDTFEAVCAHASSLASDMPGPVTGSVGGIGSFEPSESSEGRRPVFAVPDVPAAQGLHDSFSDWEASSHPEYHPHVTLAYVEDGDPLPAALPDTEVSFTHLSVHRGGEVRRFPFGGGVDPKALAKFSPDELRGPHGRWTHDIGAVSVTRTPSKWDSKHFTEHTVEGHGIALPGVQVKLRRNETGTANHQLSVTAENAATGRREDVARMSYSSATGRVEGVHVEEPYKRHGIATQLWDLANALHEQHGMVKPAHSKQQTPDGTAWAASLPTEKLFNPAQPRDDHGRWVHTVGMLDLYHRTTPENAEHIRTTHQMVSREYDGSTYWSTHQHGQATGYGDAVVHVRVPEHLAQLDDEFPSGEQHYRISAGDLRPEHFVHEVKPITAAQARGNSRPVSAAEFQHLATEGQQKLDALRANGSPPAGLDEHWGEIKRDAFEQSQKSWGGATIDAHTGVPLRTDRNAYALTVKPPTMDSVSVHEHASREEFDAAMDEARKRFGSELESGQAHLGVFHDDDNHRIDIDPVLVVDNLHDVETIGAATHAVGGAYNFADGNGYWPPHVAETAEKAAKADHHWKGPGQWRTEATRARREALGE